MDQRASITSPTQLPGQIDRDQQMVALWLHGRPPTTRRVYESDARRMLSFVRKPLHEITLADLQRFADALAIQALQPATIHRILASAKSFFAFAHRFGFFPFDVARPLRLPKLKDGLAERILSEEQVRGMLKCEHNPRNHAILFLLYVAGLRVSECCGLKWRDLQSRERGGQVTVFGKGGKTRTVLLPAVTYSAIVELRMDDEGDAPMFRSRKGKHLHASQVLRIVRRAAARVGIKRHVSPHWLRHAHASHALDHGAPIHLVQATLGHSSVATTGRYLHARPSQSSSSYLLR